MKTWIWILAGWFFLALPAVVQAQFEFTTNNGTLTVTDYTGTNDNVIIPDTINGFLVTGIGGFFKATGMTNITIPAGVTNVASEAFSEQRSLTSITVDEQNRDYSSTNGILFNKSQTVVIQVPPGISGRYTIPGSVLSIGDGAFENCVSLTNLIIGANVNSIGNDAFTLCTGLTDLAIPNGVTNIGSEAFVGCRSLVTVELGINVASIGSGAFGGCQGLTAFTVAGPNMFYRSVNGVLFDRAQLTLIQAPGGIVGNFAIPAGTTSIEGGAFADCLNLTGVTMPNSVTNIGSEAFAGCGSLTEIQIGTNVTGIGDSAFSSAGSEAFEEHGTLTDITIGTNVNSLGLSAFADCAGLANIVIPNSVATMGTGVFQGCGILTNISLGTNIKTIGSQAFADCSSLTRLAIPGSVTNIVAMPAGSVGFPSGTPIPNGTIEMVAGCGSLTAITVDAGNPAYSSRDGILFDKAQTTILEAPEGFAGSYAVPGGVTSIGGYAFQNCASLTNIVIPAGVTNIGTGAFADCGSLTAITVDGLNNYFSSLDGVLFDKPQTTLIQFPGGIGGSYAVSNGITSLGSTAFAGCSNLTCITIPDSVTKVGGSTFEGCVSAGIFFAGNAPEIASSGIIILPAIQIIQPIFSSGFYNPNGEAIYYLPGTTGWSANFDGVPAYLWDPPYVCTPGSNAMTLSGFNGTDHAITIPDTINGLPVTAIAAGAFDNGYGVGLTNIVLGTNVTTIGNYAFAACVHLTSITIPEGVTNLGSGVFVWCDSLNSIYFQGNAPAAGADVFFQWSGYPIYPPVYEPPTPTTVYYLPGTTGWGATFGGQPTVLWNPQAETSGESFGVGANGFGFNITGSSNLVVVVEASTNLFSPNWQPVQTLTLTGGTAYFSDPRSTNCPNQFYRLRSP